MSSKSLDFLMNLTLRGFNRTQQFICKVEVTTNFGVLHFFKTRHSKHIYAGILKGKDEEGAQLGGRSGREGGRWRGLVKLI